MFSCGIRQRSLAKSAFFRVQTDVCGAQDNALLLIPGFGLVQLVERCPVAR
jgi:hypothetical protein